MKIWFVVLFLMVEVFCKSSLVCHAKEEVQRFSGIYDAPQEIPEAESEFTAPDGLSYELRNSEVEEIYVPGRTEAAGSTLIYEAVGKHQRIPETANVRVKDEESKIKLMVKLPLSESRYIQERWKSFQFRLVFHEYDANVYLLNGMALNVETALMELSQRQEDILEMIGLAGEECRYLQYGWEGEPYLDDSGFLCRDVQASGERKVWDCRALYEGDITVPGYNRYRMRYSYMEKPDKNGRPGTEKTLGVDREIAENEEEALKEVLKNRFIRALKVCLEVTVSVFLVFLAVLGFRFLLLLVRRMKEKRK